MAFLLCSCLMHLKKKKVKITHCVLFWLISTELALHYCHCRKCLDFFSPFEK